MFFIYDINLCEKIIYNTKSFIYRQLRGKYDNKIVYHNNKAFSEVHYGSYRKSKMERGAVLRRIFTILRHSKHEFRNRIGHAFKFRRSCCNRIIDMKGFTQRYFVKGGRNSRGNGCTRDTPASCQIVSHRLTHAPFQLQSVFILDSS